jgi:3-oxoacyl-[acyl-carrier-protein] synthase III
MLQSRIENIEIAGISVAVPMNKISVEDYTDVFGHDVVADFSEMTGVKNVYRALPNQTASDLAFEAASDLISKENILKESIGILYFVTQKPDYRVPSTAFLLQKRLGLSQNCSCFDINLACSGYLFCLQTAMATLSYSDQSYAIVLTGDTSSRTISPLDRSMTMLFGDSGTATLIKKTDKSIVASFGMNTDGKRFKAIITPAGAYRNRGLPLAPEKWSDDITRSDYDTHMKGMDVFGFSITDVPRQLKEFMEANSLTSENIDFFILHQANMFILKQISRKIKIPCEKMPVSLDRFGNNSSNSIPLVLADHFGEKQSGIIQVLMSGFGAGLSWACCNTSIDISKIHPLIFTNNNFNIP